MDIQTKVLSRDLQLQIYDSNVTVGTAESCTGGRIAEAIIATPGSSNYFKGGIICYADEIKTSLLGVPSELIKEKTAVCEEVAIAMVKGACQTLHVDFAIAVTGYAGPGTADGVPVGTIWIACGSKDEVVTRLLDEDEGRDLNLANATNEALKLFLDFVKPRIEKPVREG